jgi:hypothetical protein
MQAVCTDRIAVQQGDDNARFQGIPVLGHVQGPEEVPRRLRLPWRCARTSVTTSLHQLLVVCMLHDVRVLDRWKTMLCLYVQRSVSQLQPLAKPPVRNQSLSIPVATAHILLTAAG